ncbi:MAG: hypothetical protein II087_02155 [Muribaculaceae bacterium]|nr:hypothetical protein [Muribaculaceae bacterium]
MKNLKSILITAACAMLFSVMAWADAQVVVTGTNVRLRLAPSLNSQTLTYNNGVNVHPKKGEKLTCTGKTGDFYQVIYKGQKVYISKQFATPVSTGNKTAATPAANKSQRYVVVTGVNVRLRKSPSIKGAIYTVNQAPVYPKKGERIKYMEDAGDFYKVNYNGNYLYISKQFSRLE